jgi:hypothetical protein
MRRIAIIILGVCLASAQLSAQKLPFGPGDKVLNLGAGLGSTWYSGTYYTTKILPISASLEFGLANYFLEKGVIGAGPYIGYNTFKNEYRDGGYNYTIILMGLRGNFHYPMINNLDTYASLFLGYNRVRSEDFGTPAGPPESSGLKSAFYLGGRYFIGKTFALLAEMGYGITYLNLGIALNF